MTERLGAWSNAPLAYVLAEVRTEQLADIKNYLPAIGGRLRDEFPIQRRLQSVKFVAMNSQPMMTADQEESWEYATPDNRIAAIFRTNGIVLHATSYTDSQDFLQRLARLVDVLVNEVPAVFCSQLGLRYVDFVLPRDNETPEQYMDSRLNADLGLSDDSKGARFTTISSYNKDNGTLSLRYARGMGQPQLPPDIAGVALKPSPLMKSEHGKELGPTSVLDTDRIFVYSSPERIEKADVMTKFQQMKADIKQAFTAATTKFARSIWNPK